MRSKEYFVPKMGLADRPYMRDGWSRPSLSITAQLMIVITAAFVLQEINRAYIQPAPAGELTTAESYLALNSDGLKHGYLWQLLTFQFLHGGVMHLLFNLLGLWFLGRFVENCVGGKNFLKIYIGSGVMGGLLQALLGLLVPSRFGASVLGASAGVCGILAAAAMIVPNEKLLLWFVLPVRALYVLIGSIILALFFVIVPSDTRIAHAAHLGGLLAGVAFIRWQLYAPRARLNWHPFQKRQPKRKTVKAVSLKSVYGRFPSAETDDLPSDEFISREVDPILDKISAHGIQSLTERERKILEAARARMAK